VLVPSQCCKGGFLTHICVCMARSMSGGKQSVSVPYLLSFGAGEEQLGKSEVSNSGGPTFPELPLHCTAEGLSLFASAAHSAFLPPAAGQPAAL